MASYNAQLKNGPGDDIYPIVRNVRAEMPQASFDLIDDVVVYVGPTTTEYVNGHRYQCVQNGSVYSWADVTGENNTPVSGGNVNAFDGDLYTVRLSDGALTTVNFMPIRYSGDKDFNFGMKVTQATNTGAIAITCNNKAVWWSDGNMPPNFDEGNQAPAVSLPETTYMLRFHWDCDANALMGNAEYLYPAYGEMSPVDGSRGVFIKSGTTVVSSAMTISGATISSGVIMTVYHHGEATYAVVTSGGKVNVSSGGVARAATLSGGGIAQVNNGGTIDGNTVYGGGSNMVYSGGVCQNTNQSAGYTYVYSGGYAENHRLTGGYFFLSSSGTAYKTVIKKEFSVCEFHVARGSYSSETIVSSGGKIVVSSGGRAQSTTISSGASAIVYAEGVMNGGLIKSGGYVHCYADGTLVNLTVEEGATVVDDNV